MSDPDDFLRNRQRPPPPRPGRAPAGWAPPAFSTPSVAPKPVPARGWRRAVHVLTFGLINPGPSAIELAAARDAAMIRTRLRGHYKVGVLGKGGVGKTSVAASVGSVFAELRPSDRVVAVDADTAFGRLGGRIDPNTRTSYWELAARRSMQTFDDLAAVMGRNHVGLYVLAGESPTTRRRVLDPAVYREAAALMDLYFTISVIDCGSTMDSPVTREALRDLDALIVVSSPWADGAAAAAQTLGWLADSGLPGLLSRTVLVLNDSDGHSDRRTRTGLAHQFNQRGRPVIEVPFDPHLRPGGVIDVSREMSLPTRAAFLAVAATVTHYFSGRRSMPPA